MQRSDSRNDLFRNRGTGKPMNLSTIRSKVSRVKTPMETPHSTARPVSTRTTDSVDATFAQMAVSSSNHGFPVNNEVCCPEETHHADLQGAEEDTFGDESVSARTTREQDPLSTSQDPPIGERFLPIMAIAVRMCDDSP